jgi:putative endonuclease
VNEDHELGAHGEDAAVRYLQGKGFKFITRGFRTQRGEVDAILRDKDVWVFLEVKTRRVFTLFRNPFVMETFYS